MGTPLILLADDEAHITHLVARRLEREGCRVVVAQDGDEAWRLVQESPPDLVVTDLQMPYMSGIEFAILLREHEATASIPVVMLTARGYVLDEEKLARANITEMWSKPFGVRKLVERIGELLEASGHVWTGTVRDVA